MDLGQSKIIESYGLIGVVILFCGYFMWITIKHFIQSIDRKDEQLNQVISRFVSAVSDLTNAIHEYDLSNQRLSSSINNVANAFDRTAAQNRDEHGQILEYVRKAS